MAWAEIDNLLLLWTLHSFVGFDTCDFDMEEVRLVVACFGDDRGSSMNNVLNSNYSTKAPRRRAHKIPTQYMQTIYRHIYLSNPRFLRPTVEDVNFCSLLCHELWWLRHARASASGSGVFGRRG